MGHGVCRLGKEASHCTVCNMWHTSTVSDVMKQLEAQTARVCFSATVFRYWICWQGSESIGIQENIALFMVTTKHLHHSGDTDHWSWKTVDIRLQFRLLHQRWSSWLGIGRTRATIIIVGTSTIACHEGCSGVESRRGSVRWCRSEIYIYIKQITKKNMHIERALLLAVCMCTNILLGQDEITFSILIFALWL
jgi:hypothetical protein